MENSNSKKTRCFSVRVESLVKISDKAYRAHSFNGSSDIIPASQVFGRDLEVEKSDAYWISAWILSKKTIQYSGKKVAWFYENGKMLPSFKVEKHTPAKKENLSSNQITELEK